MLRPRPAAAIRDMPEKKRPTVWIVVTCVLAVAVVGLGIWAFSAQSDADDAKAALATKEQAASEPTPAPTAAPAATTDPAVQQAIDDTQAALGGVTEDVAQMQADLEQAATNFETAQQKAQDASGAVDKLRAEADAFKARAELATTCLKGSLDALKESYTAGGTSAAAEKLKALAGQCRAATES
jgi:peptidoglycan hydrolase CwlO-like protein